MTPIDLARLRVYPLASRKSLTTLDEIRLDPDAPHGPLPDGARENCAAAAADVRRARTRGAAVILIYGAHLLRNGAAPLVDRLLASRWVTHLATNGAGTIHDWEFAHLGRSSESVRDGVATGSFGTWDETGKSINLAVAIGGLEGLGYGRSLGRWIDQDGGVVPSTDELAAAIAREPRHAATAARADLLRILDAARIPAGRMRVEHPHRQASIVHTAYRHGVPLTVHPGIGYDIITNHPCFSGAAIGRGADVDFRAFGGSLDGLDGGVILSIGSAIMGPQVVEKSLSCVNNLRLQAGRAVASDFDIHVVDLQDGGRWDWSQGEPPKTSPAYYLRFCKSYARMGGRMQYTQCHNVLFMHALWRHLAGAAP
jgi:hypothetical protein